MPYRSINYPFNILVYFRYRLIIYSLIYTTIYLYVFITELIMPALSSKSPLRNLVNSLGSQGYRNSSEALLKSHVHNLTETKSIKTFEDFAKVTKALDGLRSVYSGESQRLGKESPAVQKLAKAIDGIALELENFQHLRRDVPKLLTESDEAAYLEDAKSPQKDIFLQETRGNKKVDSNTGEINPDILVNHGKLKSEVRNDLRSHLQNRVKDAEYNKNKEKRSSDRKEKKSNAHTHLLGIATEAQLAHKKEGTSNIYTLKQEQAKDLFNPKVLEDKVWPDIP